MADKRTDNTPGTAKEVAKKLGLPESHPLVAAYIESDKPDTRLDPARGIAEQVLARNIIDPSAVPTALIMRAKMEVGLTRPEYPRDAAFQGTIRELTFILSDPQLVHVKPGEVVLLEDFFNDSKQGASEGIFLRRSAYRPAEFSLEFEQARPVRSVSGGQENTAHRYSVHNRVTGEHRTMPGKWLELPVSQSIVKAMGWLNIEAPEDLLSTLSKNFKELEAKVLERHREQGLFLPEERTISFGELKKTSTRGR